MTDVLDGLPEQLQATIRRIWETSVKGGSARFQRSRDRGGLGGQKEISRLIQQHGIPKGDRRWTAILEHGRSLYYGAATGSEGRSNAAPMITPGDADKSAYTKGSSFRARMEARQRQFRAEVLRAGFEKHGHHLDQAVVGRGSNFLHPAALASAEARIAMGKGVDRARTFGNMLASQTMCFNLFGPLATTEEGREIAAAVLAPFVRGLATVRTIVIEHTPSAEVFRDQSGPAGVDSDVLIEFEDEDGSPGVLVIETKLVEPTFSRCGHRNKSAPTCPTNVQLGEDFAGCQYVSKNRFLYWQRSVETKSLRLPLVREAGCPFGGASWQLWVNHTLAHVEAARRGARRAVFAVCAPAENAELLEGGAVLARFREFAADPESVVFISLEKILAGLKMVTADHDVGWRDWAATMVARYVLDSSEKTATADPPAHLVPPTRASAVTHGQRQVVKWMAGNEFRQIVDTYATATNGRGRVYFRPTDRGVVMVGLHDEAPVYAGLRTHASDDGYLLRPGSPMPSLADAEKRWLGFESWVRSLRRPKEEERGVIVWLRCALEDELWLRELGNGWVFLHQEWRFIDDAGRGKKSDILAVHLPTGRLAIVELKDSDEKLPEARNQVEGYGRFWKRDAAQLAPLFTELLRAQGALYGNRAAVVGTVSTMDAALFVGVATRAGGVRITPR